MSTPDQIPAHAVPSAAQNGTLRRDEGSMPRMLVIGDAMIDAYLETVPVGISDEAPVPVVDWAGERRALGGALNVAVSLARLGCRVQFIGLIGDHDEAGEYMRDACRIEGIDAQFFGDDGRRTTQKTRIVAGQDYLARLDDESTVPPTPAVQMAITSAIADAMQSADIVIISDYCKGALWPDLARSIVDQCRGKSGIRPLLVDTKPEHMQWFAGATLIKPNRREALAFAASICEASEEDSPAPHDPLAVGAMIAQHLKSNILLTLGPAGMMLFDPSGTPAAALPAMMILDRDVLSPDDDDANDAPYMVVDVRTTSGAGDVVLSIVAVGYAKGNGAIGDWYRIMDTATEAVSRAMSRDDTCTLCEEDRPLIAARLHGPTK